MIVSSMDDVYARLDNPPGHACDEWLRQPKWIEDGWGELRDFGVFVSMQMNGQPDLCCLGLSLMQPLALTLLSRLVVSEQHGAAAHALHPATS